MTITLEVLEEKQSELSNMIETFKKQSAGSEVEITAVTIKLKAGEHYAGLILGDSGAPLHHLILLPGDVDGKSWLDAKEWAAKQGGDLPTRREQSLLFSNLKSQFESRWYWSGEKYESNDADAWCQVFDDGFQFYDRKDDDLCRARAVRRLFIE